MPNSVSGHGTKAHSIILIVPCGIVCDVPAVPGFLEILPELCDLRFILCVHRIDSFLERVVLIGALELLKSLIGELQLVLYGHVCVVLHH